MRPWFERYPDRLERELAALKAANITVTIDAEARKAGTLRLRLGYPDRGGRVALNATYPDLFPHFRPEVASDELELPRHQSLVGGGLCLIGRSTSRWFAEDTLADLLVQQMPALLDLNATGDLEAVYAVEEPQGEPASDYYNSASTPGSYILIDSAWAIPAAVTGGKLRVRCRITEKSGSVPVIEGYVSEILGADGASLAKWRGPMLAGYDKTLTVPWLRRAAAIPGDAPRFVAALAPDELQKLLNESAWKPTRYVALGAVLYPEEIGHKVYGDGWAMLQWTIDKRRAGRARGYKGSFVRTARAGLSDLEARMPAVHALAGKKVVVFGLGAIGAPAAIELARAGVGKLIVVDHDVVEPATVRRWPIGWSAFGRLKAEVVKERLNLDYPWTSVHAEIMKVGATDVPGTKRQGERLAELFEGCDLIFDATAEMGVNQFLSAWAGAAGIPYVIANATPGIWGGMVARFVPGDPACWLCLRHALYGTSPTIELPPADPAGETQPPGCADPTFTGTGFDVQEVSLEAVRTIVGLLSGGAYPQGSWNVSTLELRREAGRAAPTWTAIELGVHADCPAHGG